MLHVVKGNLLTSDCTVIGHQCNCFSTMGAGIAKQIKAMFPQVYKADQEFPLEPKERLGKMSFAEIPNGYFFNLYGQFHYGTDKKQTDYEALASALTLMQQQIEIIKQERSEMQVKIGFPFGMGCGLAGGDWSIVEKMIARVFDGYDVYLYQLK
ncbi:macro domain-containing protein [Aneurinibacillus sp. REN35]|uniref:Appr-1-p processing protein n=1 Tax=Aneurinibacillus sp. REN35 TaxID=3237286 RepID=UPI00352985BC